MINKRMDERVEPGPRSFVVRHPTGVLPVVGAGFVWIARPVSLLLSLLGPERSLP